MTRGDRVFLSQDDLEIESKREVAASAGLLGVR